MKLYINFLLSTYVFYFSACVKLNPLENNDKLQSINSEFIAEWQWESWPIKQNASEKDIASPGPRVNAALWKDNNGQNWYLFGGRPIDPDSEKIYSDVWKYSVVSRVWERVFPFMNPPENKGKFPGKLGGMVSLRVDFFDENNGKKLNKHEGNNIILCGRSAKRNVTKTKKNIWSNFSRRKVDTKTNTDESKSLAVYGPRTSKSNTVWQIDLKDKLWTGYVCCCDTSNYDKMNPSPKDLGAEVDPSKNQSTTEAPVQRNQTSINDKIDKTEDEVDSEQEHMTIDDSRTKKKKINQIKKGDEEKNVKKVVEDGRSKKNQSVVVEKMQNDLSSKNASKKINTSEVLKNFSTETVLVSKNQSDIITIFKNNSGKNVRSPAPENRTLAFEKDFADDLDLRGNLTDNGKTPSKLVSKYCPDFTNDEEPVSWCDGNNDALITVDLSSSQIILWVFSLKTSHWSQRLVEVDEDTQWPRCSNSSSIRYAGSGDEVYMLCSAAEYDSIENSHWNITDSLKNVTDYDNSTKLVYRISSKRLVLESLGKIRLDRFFNQSDSRELWRNESRSTLQVIRISSNETILLLAYKDYVDLWILLKSESHGYHFQPIENVWRGSAGKWFSQYNVANYNFQFLSECNQAETVLILNPRSIPFNEYWPRERGRFIIRILKNENLRNHSIGNQSREHNLTYDLLQSDINSPITDGPFSHSYNIKVVIFFGISLAIFAVFGVVLFLKKCVNCPSRILAPNECHKSPPVIRYSVMHDDLLYPAA
ncbi:UNVERIFIED_CONTAM: hypothetical protein PYX00_010511 [Menopon gallinae]|uniref:Uncharacterized protein n=1 Tax=Menopon gallinae TaxID=328185 RepID=A0AAW2HFW2_9NEOP